MRTAQIPDILPGDRHGTVQPRIHPPSIAERLLSGLDDLVRRHRALALHTEHVDLHAELIAAEVAHELAVTRSALSRHPQSTSPEAGRLPPDRPADGQAAASDSAAAGRLRSTARATASL